MRACVLRVREASRGMLAWTKSGCCCKAFDEFLPTGEPEVEREARAEVQREAADPLAIPQTHDGTGIPLADRERSQ